MNSIPEAAIALIKEFEGFRANAYPDPITHWQLPTIGYGTTIYPDGTHVKQNDTITEARACECLSDHVAKNCTTSLTKIPNWVKMNSNQQSALYSFAYNLGSGFIKVRISPLLPVFAIPQNGGMIQTGLRRSLANILIMG